MKNENKIRVFLQKLKKNPCCLYESAFIIVFFCIHIHHHHHYTMRLYSRSLAPFPFFAVTAVTFLLFVSNVAQVQAQTQAPTTVLLAEELAAEWQAQDPNFDTYSDAKNSQRLALVTFFYATGGETSWQRVDNWLSYEVDECQWYSRSPLTAVCDENGNYLDLDLRFNGLTGNIPTGIAAALSNTLQKFELGGNFLSGSIPSEIGLLTRLDHFNLARNNMNGTLPTTLGNLVNAINFGVRENAFSGTIPVELEQLTQVKWLMLGDNQLTGKYSNKVSTI